MKRLLALGSFALLVGCGADGAPIRPEARVGVSLGSEGVSSSAQVTASQGPLTVSVGL